MIVRNGSLPSDSAIIPRSPSVRLKVDRGANADRDSQEDDGGRGDGDYRPLLPSHAGRQPRLLRQPEIPMRFNIDRAFRTEWMRRDMGYERALVLTRLMVLAPGGRGL